MLTIHIPATEKYDSENNEFYMTKECTLQLEHSLVSVSKWEAKWQKPFLTKEPRSVEETVDYIRCMTITQNVNPDVYYSILQSDIKRIGEYIDSPQTATKINSSKKKVSRQIVTSELIYYWMISLNIPMECQKWHLNRLLTLIDVCNIKNTPSKKMTKAETLNQNAALNAARRKQLGTTG